MGLSLVLSHRLGRGRIYWNDFLPDWGWDYVALNNKLTEQAILQARERENSTSTRKDMVQTMLLFDQQDKQDQERRREHERAAVRDLGADRTGKVAQEWPSHTRGDRLIDPPHWPRSTGKPLDDATPTLALVTCRSRNQWPVLPLILSCQRS